MYLMPLIKGCFVRKLEHPKTLFSSAVHVQRLNHVQQQSFLSALAESLVNNYLLDREEDTL